MWEYGSVSISTNQWLDRLRADDPIARDELITHACDRLRQLTRSMLRSFDRLRRWEQTDDVLQNAVLRLHRSLAKVQPESSQDFFRLAALHIRRALIDLSRHYFGPRGMGRHQLSGMGGEGDRPLECSELTDEPSQLQGWTEFHTAVDELPVPEGRVFSLRWFGGMKTSEIAAVERISERTVKRRWRRASLLLYRACGGEMPGE